MARTESSQGEGGSKSNFMSIVGGKWAEKVPQGTEGAIERKNKKDVMVYEKHYDDVSGIIKSMKIEKKDFGKQLQIEIADVDEVYTLSIPVDSKFFDSFCSKIGCADLSRTLRIRPYSFTPKGEEHAKLGINIYQTDNDNAIVPESGIVTGKLPYFFTKEKPNGRPQPPKENSEMDEEDWKMYFMVVSKFNQQYIVKLMGGTEAPKTEAKSVRENKAGKKAAETLATTPDDDLPF